MRRLRPAQHLLVALLVSSALAVIWTWPLARHLSSRIPHDPGDPILGTWLLWWNAHAVPLSARWWNAPIMFPMPGALALAEHLAGVSLFSTPIQLAGASPLVAYNVAMLLSYAMSAFFAYLLVFRLTGSAWAGVCAGVAFGFAPYRAGQLAHLQVLTSQWMPLMLLAVHEYVATARWRWLGVFGGAWLIQALSNGYYLLFLPVLIGLWMVWFIEWRAKPSRAAAVAFVWILFSLPLVPVLLKYRQVHLALGLGRHADEIQRFSATLGSFAHAAPLLAFWPTANVPTQEDYLFPGAAALVVVVCALVASTLERGSKRRSPLFFYAGATVLMWALALGPGGEDDGPVRLLRPYFWLSHLPGYDALRAPARFAMLGCLCLAVAAGLAVAQLRASTGRWRSILAAVVLAGLAGDGWMAAMPIAPPPARITLPAGFRGAVIELPPDDARVSVAAMYRAMFHGRPIVNGYTGHTPPHYAILSLALRRGDASPLLVLARDQPLLAIVSDAMDPDGGYRAMVEALPGIQRVDVTGAGVVYLLPSQRSAPPPSAAWPISATLRDIGGEHLEADLGSIRRVAAIEFPLRWRFAELAERLLIEASDDSHTWRPVWQGWTGGPALAAALADPLVAPVRLDVDTRARYVRIYPAPRWMAKELRILGS